MKLRQYQIEAVNAGLSSRNGVLVLPTGSGKSLICAGLVSELGCDDGILVLQPSLEILKTNLAKAKLFGIDVNVYSASAGKKSVGKVTYATIGSIINKLDQFSHCRTILIDECHLVNAKGGMYDKLIKTMRPDRLLGMTATPYRLASNSYGSFMRILTRTRPKLFNDILHITNPRELVDQGYLLEPKYEIVDIKESMLKPNSTGAEFTEASKDRFSKENSIPHKIVTLIQELDHKHILVFVESVADSKWIAGELNIIGIKASEINANTNKRLRESELSLYESGDIRVMVNVGTLTTGYDFPALDCIVDGNPTMSAALHYQKIGRVVRPFPGKSPIVYDVSGNLKRLGNPMNYTLLKNATGNNYELYSETGRITTRNIADGPECEFRINFGKHSGKRLSEVESGYLEWASKDLSGEMRHVFYSEKIRRSLIV